MAKVVTERPRYGHQNKSLKTGRRLTWNEMSSDIEDFDSGSVRHPISRRRQYGFDSKEFSDLIGPLRRYLNKQVGRSWNKVHSELSRVLDRRSVSGRHIWNHIFNEVETECIIINRIAYDKRAHMGIQYRVRGLYVHPRTGLLCRPKK